MGWCSFSSGPSCDDGSVCFSGCFSEGCSTRRSKRCAHPRVYTALVPRSHVLNRDSARLAALNPHMPCTPPPGGVEAEHK